MRTKKELMAFEAYLNDRAMLTYEVKSETTVTMECIDRTELGIRWTLLQSNDVKRLWLAFDKQQAKEIAKREKKAAKYKKGGTLIDLLHSLGVSSMYSDKRKDGTYRLKSKNCYSKTTLKTLVISINAKRIPGVKASRHSDKGFLIVESQIKPSAMAVSKEYFSNN